MVDDLRCTQEPCERLRCTYSSLCDLAVACQPRPRQWTVVIARRPAGSVDVLKGDSLLVCLSVCLPVYVCLPVSTTRSVSKMARLDMCW